MTGVGTPNLFLGCAGLKTAPRSAACSEGDLESHDLTQRTPVEETIKDWNYAATHGPLI